MEVREKTMSRYVFGIDVGGTTVKCGLFDLEGNVLDRTFDNTAAIDVEAQETYLQSQGTDTSEMDETALAQANTGSKVFIASNVKFVDAMEDLKLTCNM